MQNSANLSLVGSTGDKLSKDQVWWSGPQFLKHSEENWPEQPLSSGINSKEVPLPEARKTQPTVVGSLVISPQRNEPLAGIHKI